ncbi:unnamed protein product [Peniophora sp. CBMAI 1063]|nr:unnamed protein product [Peniophora sp. CBMAI 1063]
MSSDLLGNAEKYWRPLVEARFSLASAHIDALDTEISALKDVVHAAMRMRNKRIGACRLPPEVLTEIFLYLRDDWVPWREFWTTNDGTQKRGPFEMRWMTVTHVCSEWRNTAIGASSLWTRQVDFIYTPLHYLPTILARCKSHPLYLEATELGDDTFREVIGWLCPSICLRLRHLRLSAYTNEFYARLMPLIAPHLVNVRSLELESEDFDSNIGLSPPLCHMTQITRLHLVGFQFPWDSPILSSNLEELYLQQDAADNTAYPTLAQFRAICDGLHSLRQITLINVVPTEPFGDTAPIHMPGTLRHFFFHCYSTVNSAIGLKVLALLRYPRDCVRIVTLDNTAYSLTAGPGDIEACLSACSLFGDTQGPIELLHARGELLVLPSERRTCTLLRNIKSLSPEGEPANIRQTHGPLSFFRLSGIAFEPYISSLRMNDLRTVTIAQEDIDHSAFLNSLSSTASCVRRMEIWLSESLASLHALANSVDGKFRLFPLLEVIVLHGVVWCSDEVDFSSELTALTALIDLRKSMNAPLKEIVVAKDAKEWGVWDALKDDVQVTFA